MIDENDVENKNDVEKQKQPFPEVFLGKAILKIYGKFTGEHSCRSVISVSLQTNFIEITFRQGCSRLNLLYIFKTTFSKNTSGGLLLKKAKYC